MSGAPDPYDTALAFGCVNAALGALTPLVERTLCIDERDIQTGVDFDAERPHIDARIVCTIRIGQIVAVALIFGAGYLKQKLQAKKVAPRAQRPRRTRRKGRSAMDNQISAVMTATMSKIKEMVDTNTVVGEPITTPDDITLIPLSRVSFAFASGGSEFPMKENKNGVGCGSGAGVKVEPMGFLIVKDGNVRMLNVMPPASNTFDRLIDMTPQVIDRIDRFIDQRKADKA